LETCQVCYVPMRARYLHPLFFLAWTLLALVVLWQYDLVGRKLDADASFMLYAGQQILRGHAPYVGVAIVKLPVSPIVAALGIGTGRAFGIEDLLAGRIAFWLCAGVLVGAVYLVGAQLARDLTGFRTAATRTTNAVSQRDRDNQYNAVKTCQVLFGSLAAAILLSSQALGIQVAEGPEAKLPMICAGMLCLVFLAREKIFWAGIAGAISFMAWQPGLIFVLLSLLFTLYAPDRKRAFLSALIGIAIPILIITAYLAANGALASMFRQTFGANANYFGEKKIAAGIFEIVLGNVTKMWEVSRDCSTTEIPLIAIGYLGMIGGALFLVSRFWITVPLSLRGSVAMITSLAMRCTSSPQSLRDKDRDCFVPRNDMPHNDMPHNDKALSAFPLLLSGAALFGFSLLDLQKCSDLTPLLPYLALGAASLLFALSFLASRFLARALHQDESRVLIALTLPLLAFLLFYGTRDAFTQPRQNGLAEQRALIKELAAQLSSTDHVQQFGDATFLVLMQRENTTRFVHLGEKQGLGILTAEGISMEQLIAQLRAANPRVITLSRAKNKAWAKPLYDWLETNYRLDSSYGASEGGTQKETDVYWLK